ncbi:unnamed protein product, partial [Polarella glacialis]
APIIKVVLSRPRASVNDTRRLPPGNLNRKLTALLPSDLLPTYSQKLGRLVPDQSVPLTPDPSPVERSERLDSIFGSPEQLLDRFRADFVFADFDPTYGPVGLSPLERERRLSPRDYMLLAASGAMANFAREVVFLPVKNLKVRLQTDSSLASAGLLAASSRVLSTEPLTNLYRALDVAVLAGLGTGSIGFGVTEFLKRELVINFPDLNEVFALILASATSVIVFCL